MGERSRLLGTGIALGVTFVLVVVIAGCSPSDEPRAVIREFTEPTETVDQPADAGSADSDEATESVSDRARRELEAQVEVVSVGYAADGGYLIVNFKAPPRLAVLWQPGELYVVDEATGVKYADIPLMPKVGRLIARPVQEGQLGYVMLENDPVLKPGSTVTVVLGGFRQGKVSVEATGFVAPSP